MRRGEIYYADLGRTVGSEINKRRPVLIVSNDANNHAAGTVTVLPITSNTSRVYPFELLIDPKESGLPKASMEFPPFRGRFTAWDSSRALRWLRVQCWTYPPLVVDG